MTSGLQASDLIILAARPSMGKTALALNIAQHVATKLDKTVAIFSLEMSKESLLTRMLCATARVDKHGRLLRLVGVEAESYWNSRGHFFAAAAESMRRDDVEGIARPARRSRGSAAGRGDDPNSALTAGSLSLKRRFS